MVVSFSLLRINDRVLVYVDQVGSNVLLLLLTRLLGLRLRGFLQLRMRYVFVGLLFWLFLCLFFEALQHRDRDYN